MRRTAVTLVLTAVLLGVGLVPAEAAPRDQGPFGQAVPPLEGGRELDDDYHEVTEQEAALIADVEAARDAQARLGVRLDALARATTTKTRDLAESTEALATAEDVVLGRDAARRQAESEVRSAQRRLRDQIVASYVAGGPVDGSIAEAVLAAKDGEDLSGAVVYSRAIVGETDALVADVVDAQAPRRTAATEARRAREQASAVRDARAQELMELDAEREQQERLAQEVARQVVAEQDALELVKAQKASIEARIATLEATSKSIGDLLGQRQAGQSGDGLTEMLITNPLPGTPPGSAFGLRRHPILDVVRPHEGVDMSAPSGAVIYAPADGVVIRAGASGGYGNTTVIDHGSSLATLYGHQSRIDVVVGQRVDRGDLIGAVGSTGLSTGPHLHFETRVAGTPVDPVSIVDFTRPEVSYAAEAAELDALLERYQDALGDN